MRWSNLGFSKICLASVQEQIAKEHEQERMDPPDVLKAEQKELLLGCESMKGIRDESEAFGHATQ